MILVAGLAIAGLAGIAAAFYFSVRPGNSRVQTAAGPGRTGTGRDRSSRPSSSGAARSRGSARSAGSVSRRAAGPARDEPVTGFGGADPRIRLGEDSGSLVADRGAGREAATGPMRSASTGPMAAATSRPEAPAGRRADAEPHPDADYLAGAGRAGDTEASRPRRRMTWRNGADVDQELWPIEAFGGVSDEQFWDDLAADKPLATTARTAQAGSGPSRGPADAYLPPRPAAIDRTAVQHAVQSVQAVAAPAPIHTQPYPIVSRPPQTAPQPVRAAYQPAESHGRGSAGFGGMGPDEDPLTSPAYSLRAKGAVDGHSGQPSPRSRNMTREQREQYETALAQEMQAFLTGRAAEARPDPLRSDPLRSDPLRSGGHRADPLRSDGHRRGSSAPVGATSALAHRASSGSAGRHAAPAAGAYPGPSHTQPSPSTNTPPYGYRVPVSPVGDPRRVNGHREYIGPRSNGFGEGNWGSYPAYPPVNGYHGRYDAWGNGRR